MKKYLELLKEIIQIKSISTDPKFKGEIDKAVDWLKNLFEKNKFKTEIFKGYDNPVVFANLGSNPSPRTLSWFDCLVVVSS